MGGRSARAALAGPGRRVRGLERRRQRRDHGARGGRRLARRRARRRDRSGGVLRLPGHPADDPADARARRARSTGPANSDLRRGRAGAPSATWCWSRGIEPNLRWRTFAEAVIEAAERLGVEMVVTLGALIADVAHTRAVPITGLASDPELVERLALSRSNYEGPTGIVGIVHDACRRRGSDLGQPLGRRPPLRRRGPEPEGGAGAAAPARGLHRDRGRGLRARGGDGPLREAGRPRGRRQPRDRGARPPARGRAGRRGRARGRATCPRATRSPRTSSASCASAPTGTTEPGREALRGAAAQASLAGQISR